MSTQTELEAILKAAAVIPVVIIDDLANAVPLARALVEGGLPVIEFLTVLPYVIPAIALVAGIVVLKPHARWFLNSDYSLVPFYVVLALPFTYRSIDAGPTSTISAPSATACRARAPT